MSSGAALSSELDAVAKDYVLLVLALGEHDGDFVDAYHGPAEWREQARTNALTPAQIATASQRLRNELDGIEPDDELVQQRVTLLGKQLLAVQTRAQQLDGVEFSFDQEAQRLYDVLPPSLPQSHFDELLGQLDRLLPGEGSVSQRRNRLQADFEIPTDKLDAVFSEAIAECQRRTQAYIDLPEGERFVVEYVNDKPWSGYNWFQGDAYSLIQVNTDLPIYIDRAIDLACHEGYPGHHVFNTLLERELVEKRGWMEFSVYPLFSPMSLIAEGSANYGIQMAFPGDERERYEAEVLFPLAGLNSERVDEYYAIERLAEQLNHAGNEAARRYLDGDIDAATAQIWLEDYALMSPERAAQRVRFIERYRSYVINYNLGQDRVREYVERGADAASSRWQRFERLLSTPISASMLQQ
ncbi:MAG: hypothetical protein HKN49_03470 [Gammaproteobacteria bacterium]|nr:hypothetical protein [Gammaproteobacteria bacterium]